MTKYLIMLLFLALLQCMRCEPVGVSNIPPSVAPGTPVGVDISHYDTPIYWPALSRHIDFVFIKATEGVTIQDRDFRANWRAAKQLGVIRGAFCLFHPSDDPAQEARYFLDTVGPLQSGDLPPVLDLEKTDGLHSSQIVRAALIWLQYVKQATGVTPIIYTGPVFMSRIGNPVSFATYPLWEAQWNVPQPSFLPPWMTWTFWQYTDVGKLPGSAPLDRDAFNGTFPDLEKLLIQP